VHLVAPQQIFTDLVNIGHYKDRLQKPFVRDWRPQTKAAIVTKEDGKTSGGGRLLPFSLHRLNIVQPPTLTKR
jgi:hypothetical protein